MADMRITLDTTALVSWASDLSNGRIRSVLASALNRAARSARKVALQTISNDIGVPISRVKPSVGKVIRASPGKLYASVIFGKSRIGIKNTSGATFSKGSGLTASTHRLTGGGSSSLHAGKAFLIRTGAGGGLIAIRIGKGKAAIRALTAEGVNTAMAQPNAAARVEWQRNASTIAAREVSAGVQAALLARSAPSDSGSDG